MKNFLDEDFMLNGEVSKKLFDISAAEPIFDYHCHLSPKEIYENRQFPDISALWLGGDHYKWRAMRGFGISEKYITGDSTGYEKFKSWAKVLPYCIGNPLYHWTHLELQRYFGIDMQLNSKTADEIWEKANKKISDGGFTPKEIIKKSNVAALCTTDDPADSLEYHRLIAQDKTFNVKVLPAFRPDKALNPNVIGFNHWVQKLSEAAGMKMGSFEELKSALSSRIGFFAEMGCVTSDQAFVCVPFHPANQAEVEGIFRKALEGRPLDACELEKYRFALMSHLAGEYHRNGMVMELHIGAMRNNNARIFEKLGPDIGFDSISDYSIAEPLSRFLDSLECRDRLPKTILFTANPKDNYVLGTMIGNFQSSETASKIQLGTAWWFSDHIDGIRRQMTDLANLGVLGKFIGMVTDSRSFLSYPRHEYFRRILCGFLGGMVENGEYPLDMDYLADIVRGISYQNAVVYFGIS